MSGFGRRHVECHEPSLSAALGRNKRDPASLAALPMWLYRYFNVLVERREHAPQLFHRNQLEKPSKQLRQVGLFHLNQLRGFNLDDFPLGHRPLQLNDQGSLELVLLGIKQAEIGENVAGTRCGRAASSSCSSSVSLCRLVDCLGVAQALPDRVNMPLRRRDSAGRLFLESAQNVQSA
ncbi:hypothetical protein [Bradyrhizobium sp. CCBAU 11386]|uniref:hypothetical protein n=1 Tax=Bradyrhizobium sp. CCBAU 11386 TaxID=1630837 RepID=UPI003FA45521